MIDERERTRRPEGLVGVICHLRAVRLLQGGCSAGRQTRVGPARGLAVLGSLSQVSEKSLLITGVFTRRLCVDLFFQLTRPISTEPAGCRETR